MHQAAAWPSAARAQTKLLSPEMPIVVEAEAFPWPLAQAGIVTAKAARLLL